MIPLCIAYNLSDISLVLGFEVTLKGPTIIAPTVTNSQADMLADC